MYTKEEQHAFDVCKGLGFEGFTYNNFCYGCHKFYGRCDGIKEKTNFPCVKYVPEKDMDKVKYTVAKDMMYQMGRLYDGKKHGVLVMSLVLSESSKKVERVVDYKVIHENTFDEEEAELVRLIYKLYLQGMGLSRVAKWLNDNGYTKKIRQNGSVSLISSAFVKGVLDNPVYGGFIAYGRRKNEKIDGTRDEYHVVKQDKDSYKLYEGQHDAIIDRETWFRVQAKRELNAFKREKTHSKEHEHMVSALLKCPVCGASMYGVVNRKKKKNSDEFYTDMWYYTCKNRKLVSGHLCNYKKHVRQDELNAEVIALVKYVFGGENDMKDHILKRLDSDDSVKELQEEKTRLEKEKNSLVSKKKKQLRRINDLDIDDEFYDDLMKTYKDGLYEINEQIAVIDSNLYQNELAIQNAQGENLSVEVYKRIIDEMIDNIDDMTDADKKMLMNLLIEKIEIYPEKQPDGRWIKSVQFKIPLNIDGKAVDTLYFDDDEDDTEGDENSLRQSRHDETVVLMSRG